MSGPFGLGRKLACSRQRIGAGQRSASGKSLGRVVGLSDKCPFPIAPESRTTRRLSHYSARRSLCEPNFSAILESGLAAREPAIIMDPVADPKSRQGQRHHRHRHGHRVEGRASQRLQLSLPARCLPVRAVRAKSASKDGRQPGDPLKPIAGRVAHVQGGGAADRG